MVIGICNDEEPSEGLESKWKSSRRTVAGIGILSIIIGVVHKLAGVGESYGFWGLGGTLITSGIGIFFLIWMFDRFFEKDYHLKWRE